MEIEFQSPAYCPAGLKNAMIDSKHPIACIWRKLHSAGRHSLGVLLGTGALGVVAAHAVDATWVGNNAGDPTEWIEPLNWSGGAVPDGIATFTNTGQATVDVNG